MPTLKDQSESLSDVADLVSRELIRETPRYRVSRGIYQGKACIIKEAREHPPYEDQSDGLMYTPAAQLAVESSALQALSRIRSDTVKVPQILRRGDDPLPWYIREEATGTVLGLIEAPFFFNDSALDLLTPDMALAYCLAVGEAGTALADGHLLLASERLNRLRLNNYNRAATLLADTYSLSRSDIISAGKHAKGVLLKRPLALAHGEPYPPHMIVEGSTLALIDWENCRLDYIFADISRVWLRAYGRPAWQQQLYELLSAHEHFRLEAWRASLLLQSVANFEYLTTTERTTASDYDGAAVYCATLALDLMRDFTP